MTLTPDGPAAGIALDDALEALPREIEPRRDLWPRVAARIEPLRPGRRRAWLWPAAAAVLLVAGSSLLTATWLRGGGAPVAHDGLARPGGAVTMPAAFGPAHTLSPEYEAARRQLTVMLQQRVARMPPGARRKFEANLAELQRAAHEINEALEEAPGDPLLEELLLSTYQQELAVLAAANQLTGQNPAGTAVDATRMQL
jgi:hypothetical protein